ncbi:MULTISPECIES: MOSC domain-containing protein [Halolamina]|uniref:MOSC domain-containing protein n=1 Tax=Halolamina pelagica TaxID=699431 RepID=A0A1I5MAT2_9EURY|nr:MULTISPECIES: MOSC domain-containing protein [Halolamina]NHX35937.1 MOSC domain-containing protein [Halolamina sp. R1-12]SFP06457.1 MOSC domain-containing protein [Halolamina pelagica]
MTGTVESVHVAGEAGAPPERREAVDAVVGKGLQGDRYFENEGTFSEEGEDRTRDVTLIEAEAIEQAEAEYDVSFDPGAHRRNLTVRGIGLNRLLGERFRVGDAVVEGTELCEPCTYLERELEEKGVQEALVHRGGLRCAIVEGGEIGVGDDVVATE